MGFSSIPDRSNGQTILYSWFNALKDAGKSVETSILAVMCLSSSQSVSVAGEVKIQLNAVQENDSKYDTLGGADITTNFRYTCKKAGFYRIWGQIGVSSYATSSTLIARVRLNGDTTINGIVAAGIAYTPSSVSSTSVAIVPIVKYLNLGDYLELLFYSPSDSNYMVSGNLSSPSTFLALEYIGS